MAREKFYQNSAEKQAVYRRRKKLADGSVVRWLEDLVDTGAQFGTVYVDPPWPYDYTHMQGSVARHYATMDLTEMAALPVAKLVAKHAHCHLWTTVAFQEASYVLLRAWGFEPKSQAIWCKPQMGRGHYWRVSHEILLLGVKGHATFRQGDLKSWFECGRREHSRKPDQVRHWIQQASPGPYLELFGRIRTPGWTVFGDQVKAELF